MSTHVKVDAAAVKVACTGWLANFDRIVSERREKMIQRHLGRRPSGWWLRALHRRRPTREEVIEYLKSADSLISNGSIWDSARYQGGYWEYVYRELLAAATVAEALGDGFVYMTPSQVSDLEPYWPKPAEQGPAHGLTHTSGPA